ncbi:MAG: hypothetical protein K2Z81_22525, partial [Cyanobacteria bacterium]|nr:hypothetical protein [Cyanobacteriota bacterium]
CYDSTFKKAAEQFKGVKHWIFHTSHGDGSGLKYLASEPVDTLGLPETPFESKSFKVLKLFKGLKVLDLTSCNLLKDSDLEVLQSLPVLEEVTVSGATMTGNLCNYLGKIPTLKGICIPVILVQRPPVKSDLVNLLKDPAGDQAPMPQSQENGDASSTASEPPKERYERMIVTSENISGLAKLKELSRLTMGNVSLSLEACKALARLKHLQELNLIKCTISDGGAKVLGASKSIKNLNFRESKVPKSVIDDLRKKGLNVAS